MFVPLISVPSKDRLKKLYPRKGGGGGGGGKGSSAGKSGKSPSGGSSSGSTGARRSTPVSSGGTSKSAVSYGPGSGKVTTIPAGQLFAGRSSGGGTRTQIYGNEYVLHLTLQLIASHCRLNQTIWQRLSGHRWAWRYWPRIPLLILAYRMGWGWWHRSRSLSSYF